MDRRKLLGFLPLASIAPVVVMAAKIHKKHAQQTPTAKPARYRVEWEKYVKIKTGDWMPWDDDRPYKEYKNSWDMPMLPVYLKLLEEIGAEVVEIRQNGRDIPIVVASRTFETLAEADDYRDKLAGAKVREGCCSSIKVRPCGAA